MGDFSSSFGMGFEIGSIIKEKRKAKKILEQVQNTIQEWKLSGEEPSYVDKVLMSVLLNQAGTSYAASFADIENNKNTMDREKLSQDGMNLRTLNDNGVALLKMIETSAKEGTLGLIDWFQVPKEMFPPNFDLNKFLSKDTITKLQNEDTRQEALDEVMGITRALPEEYRKGYMEQQGVLEEGLQPTPKEAPQMSAADSFFIEKWQKGEFSTDVLLKHFSAYIGDEDKRTTLQKELDYGKEQGITFTPEEVKKKILGTAGGGDGEILRTDIAYWEKTFNDVTSEDEYNRQYALLKQSKTSKQYEPKPYKEMLQSEVKAMAQELKGLLTSDNKFPKVKNSEGKLVEDEKSKATYAKYQRIYEQKVRELIAKYPDIDISQFPKFLPIEEIKPVGFLKGMFTTGGVAKGDYSVIDTKGW